MLYRCVVNAWLFNNYKILDIPFTIDTLLGLMIVTNDFKLRLIYTVCNVILVQYLAV